jgi:hypothetical protein
VSGDTNDTTDIFVYDTVANTTRRVSVDDNGTQGNGYSQIPSISADGRYVAFMSDASNLVSGDTNYADDIFVYDTVANTTRRVSVGDNDTEGNDYSYYPSISADGRYVAFTSFASNLVSGDTNGTADIFVYDTVANTTRHVSVSSNGTQGNDISYYPSISADGSYVAFTSFASNLVSGDTNDTTDIFVSNNDLAPKIPVAWWKLDGTTGTTAADSAGTNDGILQNSPTPIAGKVDNALSFDGVNDYVVIPDNDALDFGTGDFAISTWIKTSNSQELDVILDKRVEYSGPVQGYSLFNYFGKLGLQLADAAGWTNYVSNISVADGQWHQVSVSVDRDNLNGGQWYIDGKLVETFNPTGRQGSLSNSKALKLGNRSDSTGDGSFNGSLDEVQLFNKALSATEVKAIFQNQPLAKAIDPDFNSDGKGDILWRNSATGQNSVWQMDGTNLTTGVALTPVADADWGIGGTGDFNGDGKEDILWRHSATGQNVVWQMDGTNLTTGVPLTPIADTNWSIGGTGDYNQDGQVDILWRNGATGQDVAWLMNGTQLATGVPLTSLADSNWQIVA